VREWGLRVMTPWGVGINGLDPNEPEHLAFIADLEVPSEVVDETTSRYLEIFTALTGVELEQYQYLEMGCDV